MRRVICFAMAALCGAASGQGLLDCLEPDVLRGLLLQSQGQGQQPVISAAIPAELSALRMPREFIWIGSAERITGRVDATTNASQVTAAWRSGLAPAAARTAASNAFAASGWELRSPLGMGMTVFNLGMPLAPACRDGQPVNINSSAMDGVTYVLVTLQRGNSSNSICNQPVRPFTPSSTDLEKYLPRLAMPADPATGEAVRSGSGGTGFGDGAFNAHAEFTAKDSAGNIARHFARQMAEQGWTSDANWSGAISAGSSWSRQDDGVRIQSTLSVAALDGQRFVSTLRVLKLQ